MELKWKVPERVFVMENYLKENNSSPTITWDF